MQPFAHREIASALWIKQGIAANTLTSGSTIDTYSASPQPAAGVDAWDGGQILPRRLMLVANVGAVSGTGTLTISVRDDDEAITTANGDANTELVATLEAITEPGIYIAELSLDHIFPHTDEDENYIKRYHSVRAVAADCNFTFAVDLLYGNIDKRNAIQDATVLDVTYNDPAS